MKFAVIGAGSGGQCMAAHLTQLGHEAVLYDIDQQNCIRCKSVGRFYWKIN